MEEIEEMAQNMLKGSEEGTHPLISWLSGHENYIKRNPKDRLLLKVAVTAKCRFNAALRLKYLDRVTFLATTLFSLGMIFIPLIQHTEIKLGYPRSSFGYVASFFCCFGISIFRY